MATLTIKDIAKLCGVGTSTVSRAINDDPGINKDTKARILKVIDEYNFVPNNSARNLKILESNTIALIIKGVSNPFFQSMYRCFAEELSRLEFDFFIQSIDQDEDEVIIASELAREKKLKGIIFLGGLMEHPGNQIEKIGVPYVRCTGATLDGQNWVNGSSISIDDVKESCRAVEYLINKGHKRIAFIASRIEDESVGMLRLKGYRNALEAHNIEFDKSLIAYTDRGIEPYSAESGYVMTKRLIEQGLDFTAIFTSSDVVALGAYKAICESGKKVPQDYSIMGFDGIDLANYYNPGLTTMQQPIESMVKASVDQMVRAINGMKVDPVILFDAKLIERDSVK